MYKKVLRYWILLLLIFPLGEIYSQKEKEIDSLKTLVSNSKDNIKKINLLRNIAELYRLNIDYKNGIYYIKQAVKLSVKLKLKKEEAANLNALGWFYADRGEFQKALAINFKVLEIMKKVKNDLGIGESYFFIAQIFREIDGFNFSNFYFNKALTTYKKAKSEYGVWNTLGRIGDLYLDSIKHSPEKEKLMRKSYYYYNKALTMSNAAKDKYRMAYDYIYLANAYLEFGKVDVKKSKEYSEKSLYFSNLSLIYFDKKTKYPEMRLVNLINAAMGYELGNDTENALKYYFEGYNLSKSVGAEHWNKTILVNLGRIYLGMKMYSKSRFYLEESIKLHDDEEDLVSNFEDDKLLADLYFQIKEYKKAYLINKRMIEINGKIKTEVSKKQTLLAYIDSESKTKSQKIFLLNKNKELQTAKINEEKKTNFYLSLSIGLIFILLLVTYNRFRAKQKTNVIIETKNKELEKLSIVARETANGILITDPNGNLEWFNLGFSKLFEWESVEEFINERGKDLFMQIKSHNKDLIIESIAQKKSVTYENENSTKSNKKLWIQTTFTPVYDQQGELIKLVFVETDISELKKSEEKFLAVNKELESFTYSVSHDLRAPLRAINGYSKILEEDYSSSLDAEGKKILNVILKNSKKMGILIDDLLAFSKLGRTQTLTSIIDMNELINSIIRDDKNTNYAAIELIIDKLPVSLGTLSLIRQVWINLISNAIKFSSERANPKVEIGYYTKDNHIVYFVKDNGAGFDMQYYDKLFGVFQRLHSQEEFEGTGIGLAIVQKIIGSHHGTVWAESQLNQGSTFYFSMPIINV